MTASSQHDVVWFDCPPQHPILLVQARIVEEGKLEGPHTG